MKNKNSNQSVRGIPNDEEHDLFDWLKNAECLKVLSEIPVKEELTPLELAVYNFLLNIKKELPFHQEKFTFEFLRNNFDLKYTADDLVNAFRNLDKKYYTECSFNDKGRCVWIKLL